MVVVFAFVKAEHLLNDIAGKVAGLDRDVGALERTLEQRPEVFEAVRMDEIQKQLAQASGWPHSVTHHTIAKKHGIDVKRLKNFRANHGLNINDTSDE